MVLKDEDPVIRLLKSGPLEVTWAARFRSMLLRSVTDLSISVVESSGRAF